MAVPFKVHSPRGLWKLQQQLPATDRFLRASPAQRQPPCITGQGLVGVKRALPGPWWVRAVGEVDWGKSHFRRGGRRPAAPGPAPKHPGAT